MNKVGILGGTFNPIHISHLMIARAAYEELALDKVLIMPSKKPPHKDSSLIASDDDRVNMIRLAIENRPEFELSTIELEREGEFTYTSDTLRQLKGLYPGTRFYFIIGGDSLKQFHTWHEPGEILKNCTLVAAGRASMEGEKVRNRISELTQMFSENQNVPEICYIEPPQMDVSSYRIRKLISYDMPVCTMIENRVHDYIIEHGLYRRRQFDEISERLKSVLKPSRYTHTLSVAKTAARLAFTFGEDPDRAYLAGLLHDCAKYLTDDGMLAAAMNLNIDIDEYERQSVQLLHAKLGAAFASREYGIEDEGILDSIRFHTTGKPGMNLLEKIIYIADYIEPGRVRKSEDKERDLEIARSVATYDLDRALSFILKCTCEYLLSPDNPYAVSPVTLKTYEYYCNEACHSEQSKTSDN